MRFGWLGSPLVHLLVLAAFLVAWPEAAPKLLAGDGTNVVPIDVVTFTDQSNISAIAPDAPMGPNDKPDPEGSPQPVAPAPDVEAIPDSSKPPPQKQNQTVDLDKIKKDIIDRAKKQNGKPDPQQRNTDNIGAKPRKGVGLQNNLSASEKDYLASKFQNCWRDTRDAADPARLRVVVHIELKKNGTLKADPVLLFPTTIPPGDIALRTAARNALNAVRICAPFSEFKPDRYAYWRAFDLDMHANGEIE